MNAPVTARAKQFYIFRANIRMRLISETALYVVTVQERTVVTNMTLSILSGGSWNPEFSPLGTSMLLPPPLRNQYAFTRVLNTLITDLLL